MNQATLFSVEGTVQEGDKMGLGLGYPTANIACDVTIPSGIYAGEAVWKSIAYPAALYKENGKGVLEAHLLDFSGNLYGESLVLRARAKVRDANIFSKKEDLLAAIARDVADIKKLCSLG